MAYRITPEEKKSIIVIETFKKNIHNKACQFNAITTWFSGYVLVRDKPSPEYESQTAEKKLWADELDIIDQDFRAGDIELTDFSENLTPLEKDMILNISYHDLEDKGWELDDSEIWLIGDLLIEEVKIEEEPSSHPQKNTWPY